MTPPAMITGPVPAVRLPVGDTAGLGGRGCARLLRNEAYTGRTYFKRTETVPDRRPGRRSRQVPRPRQEQIAVPCPAIIGDETFEAAAAVSHDNSKWSPRRAEPGA